MECPLAKRVRLCGKLTHEVDNTSLDPLPNGVTVHVPSQGPSNDLRTHVLSRILDHRSISYVASPLFFQERLE
jgi:hypothetical protein